jgi:hypothetical protein
MDTLLRVVCGEPLTPDHPGYSPGTDSVGELSDVDSDSSHVSPEPALPFVMSIPGDRSDDVSVKFYAWGSTRIRTAIAQDRRWRVDDMVEYVLQCDNKTYPLDLDMYKVLDDLPLGYRIVRRSRK